MHFDDQSDRLKKEKERLLDGRELSPFDEEAVEIVASLTLRLKDARERLEQEGSIIEDSKGLPVEHPALSIEKRASAELRGWVKDRADLFGAPKNTTETKRPTRRKFNVV